MVRLSGVGYALICSSGTSSSTAGSFTDSPSELLVEEVEEEELVEEVLLVPLMDVVSMNLFLEET